MADHDEKISVFCEATHATTSEARQYLETNEWDIQNAIDDYFASAEFQAGESGSDDGEDPAWEPPQQAAGGRTLGSGAPAPSQPIPTTTGSGAPAAVAKPPARKKFATLGDLGDGGHGGHGHDDDSDDDKKQDMFAGGEKSGLAVKNPNDPKKTVEDILKKARQNNPGPSAEAAPDRPSYFSGTGQTLGGDDAPSRVIPDPTSKKPTRPKPVQRTLHFWKDGFSVEDGPLFRFDDPANGPVLALIRSGRAPLDLMDVEPHQQVDVSVHTHDSDYVATAKKYKPFSGGGRRLGSPTPGDDAPTGMPGSFDEVVNAPIPESTNEPEATPELEIDSSQPVLNIQIRLGDGSRLPSRFNPTHTIGDVYEFVRRSSPQSNQRAWVLMTTFPNRELKDKSAVLGELSDFKRGGVVVQKWT